jgi:hypothetical protein
LFNGHLTGKKHKKAVANQKNNSSTPSHTPSATSTSTDLAAMKQKIQREAEEREIALVEFKVCCCACFFPFFLFFL